MILNNGYSITVRNPLGYIVFSISGNKFIANSIIGSFIP